MSDPRRQMSADLSVSIICVFRAAVGLLGREASESPPSDCWFSELHRAEQNHDNALPEDAEGELVSRVQVYSTVANREAKRNTEVKHYCVLLAELIGAKCTDITYGATYDGALHSATSRLSEELIIISRLSEELIIISRHRRDHGAHLRLPHSFPMLVLLHARIPHLYS
ncbi:hypothetical protein K438DRAFT_1775261 [Mycena galopus ATCC 62051]|nr:hypothetical protein K438DRAFT_1775261 [Mycena galopus ATCC 62051]